MNKHRVNRRELMSIKSKRNKH